MHCTLNLHFFFNRLSSPSCPLSFSMVAHNASVLARTPRDVELHVCVCHCLLCFVLCFRHPTFFFLFECRFFTLLSCVIFLSNGFCFAPPPLPSLAL
jgi:hypothetical protein